MAEREVIMSFPAPVEWHVISRAVGAVYDTVDEYNGFDSVVGQVKLEIVEGHFEVAFYSEEK